jgi:hypothetical protein
MSFTNPTDKPNSVKYFTRASGKTKMGEVILTASVAATEGSILYPDPSNAGQYTIADSTAGGNFVVLRQTVASTDSNYASAKTVSVEIPVEANVEWNFLVGSGTFTAADVGKYCDLVDEKSVAVDTQSKNVIFITDYISSTQGRCILSGNVTGFALPATT